MPSQAADDLVQQIKGKLLKIDNTIARKEDLTKIPNIIAEIAELVDDLAEV